MELHVTADNETASIAVEGKLTVQTAPELEVAIGNLDATVTKLDIDLAKTDYVSSAGLRVLAAAEKLMDARGGEMHLLHPSPKVYEVFSMTGLNKVLSIRK